MTRLDGCPAPACDNTETPRAYAVLDDGYMAAYVCSACGWEWATEYRGEAVCGGDSSEARETIETARTGASTPAGPDHHLIDLTERRG